jgi:tRNA pseudouridine55 synthase
MILNIYKPVRWTSFDVVRKVKGITHESKVGHGGTLDPFADGVLIIGTGKDTKRLSELLNTKKSYTATLLLGKGTTTGDPYGDIISESPVPILNEDMITNVFNSYTGPQSQIPPMYSAKRVGGKRLYSLARKNIEISRKPVPITVYELALESFDLDKKTIEFNVICSKGTYIRTLGSDISRSLGTEGHLTKLTRTSVGDHSITQSISIEQLEKQWKHSEILNP